MTVLMTDATEKAASGHGITPRSTGLVHELIYADDTLLLDTGPDNLHVFMNCIADVGREYGLQFNWSKLEHLPVRMDATLHRPDGGIIPKKSRMMYLGSTKAADGRISSELSRRLGLARADFDKLRVIWSHSRISRKRRHRIFNACVVTKLMYGLQSAWLNQAERRRIDGFHARCLRVILKIPCSYISRISNAVVLARAQAEPLSTCLLRQQLRYFGKLAGRDNEDPGRACIFEPGGLGDVTPVGVRRRGRPRLEWGAEMRKHAALAAGSQQLLEAIISRPT